MPTTAAEQYLLELVNDARLDPLGNAARYITSYNPLTSSASNIQSALNFFNVSGSALQSQYAALTPVQPLAYNDQLEAAARGHNNAMIAADSQSHQTPGEADLGGRLTAQGYAFTRAGENIYAFADDPLYAHAGFMVDWGGSASTGGMQSPPGHRNNIMDGNFREIGVAITNESNPNTSVGPQVVTEDLGSRGASGALILGVAYSDTDKNNFYTIGEGTAGLTVAVGAASTSSAASGGYTLQTSATGAQTINLSGAGLAGTVSVGATLTATTNLKIDVVSGDTLKISGSAKISGAVTTIQGLGIAGLSLSTDDLSHSLVGTVGADTLAGGAGNDTMRGGLGADRVTGGFGNDLIYGNLGTDIIYGNQGSDTLFGGQDADAVFGGQGNDIVYGNLGNDVVYGNLGNDVLYGGQGNDTLYGGQGNDTLFGNAGDDVLYGNLGSDVFRFNSGSGRDLILGFSRAENDRINVGGQTYTVTQAQNGDALLNLSGGGVVQIGGVAPGQVDANFFTT